VIQDGPLAKLASTALTRGAPRFFFEATVTINFSTSHNDVGRRRRAPADFLFSIAADVVSQAGLQSEPLGGEDL
jgi:hypothetical protein